MSLRRLAAVALLLAPSAVVADDPARARKLERVRAAEQRVHRTAEMCTNGANNAHFYAIAGLIEARADAAETPSERARLLGEWLKTWEDGVDRATKYAARRGRNDRTDRGVLDASFQLARARSIAADTPAEFRRWSAEMTRLAYDLGELDRKSPTRDAGGSN